MALVLPLLIGCMGMAIDYAVWIKQRQELQRIADASAIAAARELYLANSSASQAQTVASTLAASKATAASMSSAPIASAESSSSSSGSSGGPNTNGSSKETKFGGAVSVSATVNLDDASVKVAVSQLGASFFSKIVGSPPKLEAHATARAVGGGRICVVALETEEEAVNVQDNAVLRAQRCGVFSNSTDEDGISKDSSATIEAEMVCSAGGFEGNTSGMDPAPLTDCPPIPDPLEHRVPPSVGGCDFEDVKYNVLKPTEVTFTPGVYCGGITLRGRVKARMEPGIYVMKDGPLITSLWAELRGENVGIYLTGDRATFRFALEGVVNLTAPKDGPMAGILFFEDRNSKPLRRFEIYSDDARVLLGTIYLPNGRFIVGTLKPIADESAYTAIVARRVELLRNPTLVLNADYSTTDVPVPEGIKQIGGSIVLSE